MQSFFRAPFQPLLETIFGDALVIHSVVLQR
jgi:hypothetical protein